MKNKRPKCAYCEIEEQEERCCFCSKCREDRNIKKDILEIWRDKR